MKRFINHISKELRRLYSTERKWPLNPDHAKDLPVFQYPVSKPSDRRVYVWGRTETGACGIMKKKKQEKSLQVEYIKNPHRLYFGEKHEVCSIACGIGFTVFGVHSSEETKVFGTGLNSDSQLGFQGQKSGQNLGLIYIPHPIYIPFENVEIARVLKIAAGRAHVLINTNEGLFTMGNNSYGQCGREIIEDEKYSGSSIVHKIDQLNSEDITDIVCGQDHSIAITESGKVYSCGWGADGQTGLNHYKTCSEFSRVLGDIENENIVKVASSCDCVLAINDKGDLFGWGNSEYSQIPTAADTQQICTPAFVKMAQKLGKIRDVAAGGSYCLVLNDKGEVYSWGYGLLGTGPAVQRSAEPLFVPSVLFGRNDFQPDATVVSVHSGISHMAAITNVGDLYTWGRNRSYCLGLGTDKDQYFPLKVALPAQVKKVFLGLDHTVALCKPFI